MARAYTIATAALALEVPVKWLDNTVSHFKVAGVRQERQGVARRLSIDALIRLSVAHLLASDLGMSLARALEIADEMVANKGRFVPRDELQLSLDLPKVLDLLLQRLERAVEIAPVPRRGRPPKTTTGRLD